MHQVEVHGRPAAELRTSIDTERALMAEDRYLEHGVMGAFMPSYRNGDQQ